MMVACYKANYLSVGVRIWFRVNYGSRVFGVRVNFSSERVKMAKKCQKRVIIFLDPVFRDIFLKFRQNAGFVKYRREKVEKLKKVEKC